MKVLIFLCCLAVSTQFVLAKSVPNITKLKRKVAQVNTSGQLKVGLTSNNSQIQAVYKGGSKLIDLSVPDEFEFHHWLKHENDQYVVVQILFGDDESSSGHLYIINKKTLEHSDQPMYGYNFSEPLFHEGFVYLSYAGGIFKVNLETGVKVWEVKNLYRKHRFMGVPKGEKITKQGSVIYFGSVLSYDENSKVIRSKRQGDL